MNYKIIHELSKNQIDELFELYKNEWWTNTRNKKEIEVMLNNSQVIIGIENKNKQLIGFSRVLTDYVYKAFIFDVIIHKKYRKEKLGKLLMDTILNHPDLNSVKNFELYCLEEMKSFYEKWGFNHNLKNLVFMRKD
ncbi:GCN5-related N-acetyltransferase [Arcobacter nitrofigilis DSM 7299]|uniref:GCN5-related N-acetyltransferase n=1 Tax=Arcobacter nitrofigilis (strain ATCC 33309 / DSM 7299 / CCUG 15893 / LMG 7604 / NCTC 12251 / CI) TaxID=572480 RepID=D5V088_ARCNC|nr:GNAT family N-acetyltransferase [Arcobacter nitrofigilis]ADG93700.1 GCN5-related N-acetyltransferase [Arcobacter nitrofigilis DSM 7299]